MQRFTPQRRLEILLAQLTLHIDMTMGGVKDAALSDYLKVLEPPEPGADEQEFDVAELQEAFGFNPRPRKDTNDEQ